MVGERQRIPVGIFEPRDLRAAGSGPDAEFILLEEAEAEEFDALGCEGCNVLLDVV